MIDVNMPLVSIIIPVYNGSNYMREAIDSALAQTYSNVEVIVVNDGSNDDGKTEKIALSYGDKIRYIYKENGGVSSALNTGIMNMRGEYFSWLSHDDIYEPEKIAHQVKKAKTDTVVMCGRYLINNKSEFIGDARDRFRFHEDCGMSWRNALIALLKQGCFNGCSLLIPKKAFYECGFFDENLRYCQDLLMWLRIFLGGYRLEFISDKDVRSRVHEGQLTNSGRELYHSDCRILSDLVLKDICEKSNVKENVLFYFAKYNAIYNNTSVVRDCVSAGKETGLFSGMDLFKIKVIQIYGAIRPIIRKVYYRVAKNVITQ